MSDVSKRGILERMDAGEIVIGDGGFLFALEKRGYVKFGQYAPDCTVEHPEAVRQLHREYLRAGADVMQTFTFNGTEESIESRGVKISADKLNQAACDLAGQVAKEGGALCAGGVSYTRSYAKSLGKETVQREYKKQVEIFLKNDVDFLIAEYLLHTTEAEWATEVLKATGKPTAITVTTCPEGDAEGVMPGEAAVRLARAGADIIGVNCRFDPDTCLKTIELMKKALDDAGLKKHLIVQPTAYHTPDCNSSTGFVGMPEYPFALEPRVLTRWEVQQYARKAYNLGVRYIGACCGFEPYHIRAIAEELAVERGKFPAGSEKHAPWGEAFKTSELFIERRRVGREYWENLKPATGRPESSAMSKPLIDSPKDQA